MEGRKYVITDVADVAGLPEKMRQTQAALAASKHKTRYRTLPRPLVRFHDPPILTGSRLFRLSFRVAAELVRQDFDGDFAFQFGIPGSIDFTHTALAEQGGDLVRAESCADREAHRFCGAISYQSCG